MAGIFKAYDIRGVYPNQINEEAAYKIGYVFSQIIGRGTAVVGRDMRVSSLALFQHLTTGLNDGGMDVIDVGLVTSPVIPFSTAHYRYDAGIMITASHNPKEYNGFKLSRKDAYPISYETGIADIEKRVLALGETLPAPRRGNIYTKDVLDDYIQHVLGFAKQVKKRRIVVDAGNGMAGLLVPKLFKYFPCEIIPLYFELDGNFPHHDANPLERKNVEDLIEAVMKEKADFGVAFDGDADRVMFVDDRGQIVPADMTTALIAMEFLKHHPGETILYDLRSSWLVREEIERHGGKPKMCRVGHAFIKQALREAKGIFAGELSGHYYFRDNFFADSALIALVMMLNLICEEDGPLSRMVEPLKRFHATGEINSRVKDPDAVIGKIEKKYNHGRVYHLDGLSVEFDHWWFNVRKSNTEPLLRLNLEARTKEMMDQKKEELLALIKEG